MTPQEFAKQQRDFLIRTEKQSAIVLLRKFESLKKEIDDYLTTNLTGNVTVKTIEENSLIERTLDELERWIESIRNPFTRIVARGQQQVINFAAESLRKFLEIKTSIFDPDREAIQKLIGRTQDGSTLAKIFDRMQPAVREKAKNELIEGFSAGESHIAILARLTKVTDLAKTRALTISRTETNEAYRAATREFYDDAGIKQYLWMSVLDPRTCLICWSLHGRKFKSSKKVFSHPNCRCVLVPYQGQKVKTGSDIFAGIETGFQKEILGKSGFEKFRAGFRLDDFVGIRNTDDGLVHYRRSLAEIDEKY